MRPVGVGHQDVIVCLVGDLAVGGQTERWRYSLDTGTDSDRDPDQGGRSYVLAENIKEFKLRYFDPKDDDWTDTWDTTDNEYQGRLPTLVEITMVIEDENGKELKFVTKTRINLTRELGMF